MSEERRTSPPPGKRGFEDLRFYQDALLLLKAAYKLAEGLPPAERYNLADQLRRAALSVVLNIAEGYGRHHFADKLRFMYMARGSLDETLSCFIVAQVLASCTEEQVDWVRALVHTIHRDLNGYIAHIGRQRQGDDLFGSTYVRDDLPIYHTLLIPPTDPPTPAPTHFPDPLDPS